MRNPYANNFNTFYSYRKPYTTFYSHPNNNIEGEIIEAGAALGFTGAGAALLTGKISAGLIGA